jgi:FAD/FMN-containing dehydrogenase
MNPDIHVLWPVDPARRDILQEYFVPVRQYWPFLEGLRRIVPRHRQDLLNVTLRDVRRDGDTALAYAKADSFAFVLFFSQEATPEAEADMKALTRELVELALEQGGSFYLPYRPHYTAAQFRRAYPRADDFFAAKRRYDPEGLFDSRFYEHLLGRDDESD